MVVDKPKARRRVQPLVQGYRQALQPMRKRHVARWAGHARCIRRNGARWVPSGHRPRRNYRSRVREHRYYKRALRFAANPIESWERWVAAGAGHHSCLTNPDRRRELRRLAQPPGSRPSRDLLKQRKTMSEMPFVDTHVHYYDLKDGDL